jgi:hypothetical protein
VKQIHHQLSRSGLITWPRLAAMLVALAFTLGAQATPPDDRATFGSPDEALTALKAAVEAKDRDGVRKLFGPQLAEIASGDEVQDAADFKAFAQHLGRAAKLIEDGDDRRILHVGAEAFPFPVPLVRQDGKWFFDTETGKDEILSRRVGENELGAISVCRGVVAAQFEYFSEDRDGDDVLEFAQKLPSTPGTHDGLFWEAKAEEAASPLGPLVAEARAEGYGQNKTATEGPRPYHGYLYRLLSRQGEHAPGGKLDYVINGNMVAGFALVAYPVEWGSSGIMTFIVNTNGKVYQKDLGEQTKSLAAAIDAYDVDSSWTLVSD